MSHHLVETRHLKHIYPDGTMALDNITFRVVHGESVGVIGANGAGKSTLLMHLNGYLTASSGTIIVGDERLSKETLATIRRTVGMVFQDPDDQLFMPTVYDDIAFGPVNLGLSRETIEARVNQALSRVEAIELRDKPPYRLSCGEKKRVAIATVIAMLPEILVLDEPTNGLDPYARRLLIDLLKGFHHTRIVASHDLDMIFELCERTIVLHDGKVMADGPTLEIFQDNQLLSTCRLEKPFAMQSCPVCSPDQSPTVERPFLVEPHSSKPHQHKP
ncbi:MAG: ABC transporter ATP-binding protein [Desulfuromonadales bacterium]